MDIWEQVGAYLSANWLPWVCAAASWVVTAVYKATVKRLRKDREEDKAISTGVQALLREGIIHNYNKYSEWGYCPIYAKESIKKEYAAYHTLGGNDVATELYHKLLAMDEESKGGKS